MSLLSLLAACVVSVAVSTEISEPVDRVDVLLDIGDLSMTAQTGAVRLEGDVGGVGDGSLDYEVVDRVLYIEATCTNGLCGGSIDVTAPARTALTATLTTGSVDVDGIHGDQSITVRTGSIDGSALASELFVAVVQVGDVDVAFERVPDDVAVTVGTGSIRIEVPQGAYNLDLQAVRGSVSTPQLQHDPSSTHTITARVEQGNIEVVGR